MASETKVKGKSSRRLDLATVAGLLVGVGGIVCGLLLEGGKVSDVTQLTSAMIVLLGTAGAVMVTTPVNILLAAVKRLTLVFFETGESPQEAIEQIVVLSTVARRDRLMALEDHMSEIPDAFLRKALTLAIDGTDLREMRRMLELDLAMEEQKNDAEARVFEAAGGYAPTIGIIGAVLGLMQVMKHLENVAEVGQGIAVAFVATVYGVAVSNLFLLPAANKIRARLHLEIRRKELLLEGALSIAEGMNPRLIRSKLEAFSPGGGKAIRAPYDGRSQRSLPVEG